MTNYVPYRYRAAINNLCLRNPTARALLENFANRKNNRTEISVDRVISLTNSTRVKVISTFREFEKIGVGEFKKGSRGAKSRMRWYFEIQSLGRAMLI